jgi:hypothetical protein
MSQEPKPKLKRQEGTTYQRISTLRKSWIHSGDKLTQPSGEQQMGSICIRECQRHTLSYSIRGKDEP